MSVAAAMAHPLDGLSVPQVERQVAQGREHHAAQGRDTRQDTAGPGRELAVEHLALDLQADQQEEDRHQAVVDPVLDAQPEHIGVQGAEIDACQG